MLSRGKVQESVITSVSSRDPRLLRRQAQKAHWGVGRAAGGGGEARGGLVVQAGCLLGDVQMPLLLDVFRMCSSAGQFLQFVGGQYQQALGMYEFALVCGVAPPRPHRRVTQLPGLEAGSGQCSNVHGYGLQGSRQIRPSP